MTAFFEFLSSSKRPFIHGLRISIFVVMAWIGGLKAFQYEADGIVPFVANSPFMSFFYQKNTSDADSYKQHKNKEGEVVPQNIKWHQSNGTYVFSYALGTVIFLIGTLVLLGIWLPRVGVLGGLLTFEMSLVTLSFLITTPETWVADLGGPDHGFPFLSAAGRLVIKDIIMLFGGLVCASDAAEEVLRRKSLKSIAMD
ncbi:DUF417 family protein [Chryseobacterium sp. A301]